MLIKNIDIDKIIPYARNPRKNNQAVTKVASSIQEFGFKQPVVVDKDMVIVAGHTRYEASKKLELKEIPVLIADDLTEAQIKAYRIADNKTSEYSEWDYDLLKLEIDDLIELDYDPELTSYDDKEIKNFIVEDSEDKEKYTSKITIPIYEITGEKPNIQDLYNTEKTLELIKIINDENIENDLKEFLIESARRQTIFNYQNIAEFYAHQPENIKAIMRRLALVIIDYDQAIELGYVKLTKDIIKYIEENIDE